MQLAAIKCCSVWGIIILKKNIKEEKGRSTWIEEDNDNNNSNNNNKQPKPTSKSRSKWPMPCKNVEQIKAEELPFPKL